MVDRPANAFRKVTIMRPPPFLPRDLQRVLVRGGAAGRKPNVVQPRIARADPLQSFDDRRVLRVRLEVALVNHVRQRARQRRAHHAGVRMPEQVHPDAVDQIQFDAAVFEFDVTPAARPTRTHVVVVERRLRTSPMVCAKAFKFALSPGSAGRTPVNRSRRGEALRPPLGRANYSASMMFSKRVRRWRSSAASFRDFGLLGVWPSAKFLDLCYASSPPSSSWTISASAETPPDAFERGLAALSKHEYAAARDAFTSVVEAGGATVPVLHNLALAHVRLDQKPMALGYWRKALAIDPNFAPARAGRAWLENGARMRAFEGEGVLHVGRQTLERVPRSSSRGSSRCSRPSSGGCCWRQAHARRAARDEDRPRPPWTFGLAALGLAAVLTAASLALRTILVDEDFATVVTSPASARSLPNARAVTLFELSAVVR